ncbi:MAG: dihydrofolate reductase family protein, partial [Synechococcales bacterium]|nr:dihydrofolate reductase family protein [Synechococcales bacterium]
SRSAQFASQALEPQGFDPEWRFFRQPFPRWLITTLPDPEKIDPAKTGPAKTAEQPYPGFDRVLTLPNCQGTFEGNKLWNLLAAEGFEHLVVLGGGQLVATLFVADRVDELWLTVCPLILGGQAAPSPVQGEGFLAELAPRLQLLQVRSQEQEVFLHYAVLRSEPVCDRSTPES